MTLYRVFPYDTSARVSESGGPLFAPRSGFGRIWNPDLYHELYLSTSAAGAISEAFGRLDTWKPGLFSGRDRPYAIVAFNLSDGSAICNLDSAGRLLAYDLSPSSVVTRDRDISRAWAKRIYRTGQWIGIAWWSRYDSRWQSVGLWNKKSLRLIGKPEILSVRHPAVQEAATLLPRHLEFS